MSNDRVDEKLLNERASFYGAASIHPDAMEAIHTYLDEAMGSVLCYVAADADARKTTVIEMVDLTTARKTANVLLDRSSVQ